MNYQNNQLIIQKGNGKIDELNTAYYEHIFYQNTIDDIKTIILYIKKNKSIDFIKQNFPLYNIESIIKDLPNKTFYEIATLNDLNKNIVYVQNSIDKRIYTNYDNAVEEIIGIDVEKNNLHIILELLYEVNRHIKIINARGDGQCFFHALYLYHKLSNIFHVYDNKLQIYANYVDYIYFLTIEYISGFQKLSENSKQAETDKLNYSNVPETGNIIQTLIKNLRYNIMIINYDRAHNIISNSASNIQNSHYYIMLIQNGTHYYLIYIGNDINLQKEYYLKIYNILKNSRYQFIEFSIQ